MLGELIIQIIILLMFLLLFITTFSFRHMNIGGSLGPEGWPRMLLSIGIFLTLICIYRIVKEKKYIVVSLSKEKLQKFIIAVIIMLIYTLLIKPFGFILTTLFLTAAYMYQMGIRKPFRLIFFSLLLSAVFVFLFGRVLQVNLPRGLGSIRFLSFYFY